MSSGVTTNPKEALLNEVQSEIDTMEKRLKELQTLTDQSQAEVKRLQQKASDVTTQLNRLEANFDTVPRNDIKVIYTNAIDTKTRLLTMQSQFEKIQQDRDHLNKSLNMLKHVKDMVLGIAEVDIAGSPQAASANGGGNGRLSSTTIVRLVEAQEAERQRLARQMHDGPAQSLTNFILQAEICQRLFDRNPDRASEELNNLKSAASLTFQKVRDFIFDLRPMMLDDLGLAPTMRRYVDAFKEKGTMEVRFTIVGEERRRMESHTEVPMFRSLQELLSHCRDVAMSTKVDLVLDIGTDKVKGSVSFDGREINETEAAAEQSHGRIYSLNTLKERIELVGGAMEIYSGSEGELNRVDIILPIGQVEL